MIPLSSESHSWVALQQTLVRKRSGRLSCHSRRRSAWKETERGRVMHEAGERLRRLWGQ